MAAEKVTVVIRIDILPEDITAGFAKTVEEIGVGHLLTDPTPPGLGEEIEKLIGKSVFKVICHKIAWGKMNNIIVIPGHTFKILK